MIKYKGIKGSYQTMQNVLLKINKDFSDPKIIDVHAFNYNHQIWPDFETFFFFYANFRLFT